MEETLRANLFVLAARFSLGKTPKLAALGKRILNDNTFFSRVEKGDGFNVKTFDRVVLWFSDNWPEGAEWPAEVPRPAPAERAA